MIWVVETDAPCGQCGSQHLYVTKLCTLAVYVDEVSARMVAKAIDGRAMPIEQIPDDPSNPGRPIPHVVMLHKRGLPDPAYPQTQGRLG